MTTNILDVSDSKTLTVTFTDENDVATDPGVVRFKMREPDGTVTNYLYGTDSQVVKDSTGVYHVVWSFDQYGRHFVKWNGSGTLDASVDDEFFARKAGAI